MFGFYITISSQFEGIILLPRYSFLNNVVENYNDTCFIVNLFLQVSSSDRALLTAFREIAQMAERLNLPSCIKVRSFLLYLALLFFISVIHLCHVARCFVGTEHFKIK